MGATERPGLGTGKDGAKTQDRPQVVKRKPRQGPGSRISDPLLVMNEGFPRRAGVGTEGPRDFALSR